MVKYAWDKVASVRRLHRTSLPIPHAGGTYPPKEPHYILGGLRALESDWNPALSDALIAALQGGDADGQLDIGCVAAHSMFVQGGNRYVIQERGKAATAFLLELIARLQMSATVPMIDVRAYAKWLLEE